MAPSLQVKGPVGPPSKAAKLLGWSTIPCGLSLTSVLRGVSDVSEHSNSNASIVGLMLVICRSTNHLVCDRSSCRLRATGHSTRAARYRGICLKPADPAAFFGSCSTVAKASWSTGASSREVVCLQFVVDWRLTFALGKLGVDATLLPLSNRTITIA